MQQTILFIGYVWPEPGSSAAGGRMLALLRLFRDSGYRVVFSTPAQDSDYRVDLQAEGIEQQSIRLNDSAFDHWLARLQPDMVLFDRFIMEEQFGWRVQAVCPQALRILETVDLHFLRGARQQAMVKGRDLQPLDLFTEVAQRECASIWRCDLSLIISEYEMELLQKLFKIDADLLHYLPFMLEALPDAHRWKPFGQRRNFVTIGNFRHAPNWDSVLYLQRIWPLIRKRLPDAQLHVYGAYPPKKAMNLDDPDRGFRVMGWAENALSVLAQGRVCLAPLRFGAGLKGKLLDAMLTGTPFVTTEVGIEGMAGDQPVPGRVADGISALAEEAVLLYTQSSQWRQCQQRILPLLQLRFSAQMHGQALLARVALVQQELKWHRRKNFIGGMLNYHLLRSSEYLSKWIEAKNRLD